MPLIRPPVDGDVGGPAPGPRAVDDGASPDDDVGAHATHRRRPGAAVHAAAPPAPPVVGYRGSGRTEAVMR